MPGVRRLLERRIGGMKHLILTAALAGICALYAPDSYAFFCVKHEVPQAVENASTVFVGEVAEIIRPRASDTNAPLADRLYTVKFKVEKTWRGAGFEVHIIAPEISILSDQGRAGCFSWGSFVEGEKYLVYAEETRGKDLAVPGCSRTAPVADAAGDLRELERMSGPHSRIMQSIFPG
jgi:hypothetical protein